VTEHPPVPVDLIPAPEQPTTSPGRSRRRGPPVVVAGAAAAVMVLGVLVWAVAWYESQVDAGPPGAAVVVDVAQGASVQSVTSDLARQGVVGGTWAARLYFFFHGAPVVRPGGYGFRRHESLAAVRATLLAGPDVLVVSPGFTVAEVAARLGQFPGHDATTFATAVAQRTVVSRYEAPGPGNLDGLLAPGDYVLAAGQSDVSVLEQMVLRFDAEASQAGLVTAAAALGITPYQAVVAASIVQKEGVYSENVAKVARVIYNRLARGMALQMDSTVLYSEGRDGGPVTPADLALDTPYNTYLHTGLPPTPICFPSVASLHAALGPAPGDWLYFVLVSRDGTEAFSDTLAGQLANEQLARSRGLG